MLGKPILSLKIFEPHLEKILDPPLIVDVTFRRPVNKQNGLRAEWVQEQKNKKNIKFYKLMGKLSIRIVNIIKEAIVYAYFE